MRFRTRPVEFDAFRWEGQSLDLYPLWFRQRFRPSDLTISQDHTFLGFQVGSELVVVERGGWICLSADGAIYPVTDEFLRRVADEIGDGDGKGES